MTLSPTLRRVQQSPWTHYAIAFLIAATPAVWLCLEDANGLTVACLKDAAVSTLVGLGYLSGASQHGTGSASFHTDGSENKAVEKVVTETKAMTGPNAASLTAVVVPKRN